MALAFLHSIHRYLKPSRLLLWSGRVGFVSMVWGVPLLLFAWGWGLFFSPADKVQGYSVRIMYMHVPSAYMATTGYATMAMAGLTYLLTKSVAADLLARAVAPVGLIFALVCLVTGALWGKPTWGVYWVWDARLSAMLLLFFLYVGHILLAQSYPDTDSRGSYAIAILSVIGALNLPVIRFSVEWWNTLHQPASLFRMDGPTIHGDMLVILLLSMLGVTLFALWVTASRFETLLHNRMLSVAALKDEKRR